MLPLTILSACAAVLLLPASAAPLPFETSDLQQPAGILATPSEQGLDADNLATSGAARSGALRVPRGVGFREADYAVSAATAAQTVIRAQSTKATPAVLAAAAPTRAVFSRQVADACALADCSGLLASSASATGTDPSTLSQPAVDPLLNPASLSASNNALAASLAEPPRTTADGPGPEVRPYAIKAKADPALSQNQSQLDDDAPASTGVTPLPIGGSATLAQVNAPLLMVSGTGDPTFPKVAAPSSNSNSASTRPAPKIGTVAARWRSLHERRGRFKLTRYLSGSSLYPDSDPDPKPINPRELETVELNIPAAGARKARPWSNAQTVDMGADQPLAVNVSYPPTQDA
ncbi:hypothetical protein V8D89_006098 [Ganoderma adspersum]